MSNTKNKKSERKRIYLEKIDLKYESELGELLTDYYQHGISIDKFKDHMDVLKRKYQEEYEDINNLEFTIKFEQDYDDTDVLFVVSYMESESDFKERIKNEKIKEQEKKEKKAKKIIETQLSNLSLSARKKIISDLNLEK